MLTVHTADALWPGPGREPVPGGAVAVSGTRVAAVGPYAAVVAEHPGARVRRWPGLLTPGLVNRRAPELLEAIYHPDPREADRLGTEPVRSPDLLDALALTPAQWAGSARRGLQRMLGHGTTAVTGPFRSPAVRTAVTRAGLVLLAPSVGAGAGAGAAVVGAGSAGHASLDPLDAVGTGVPGELPEAVLAGSLEPGARADFAVFDVPVGEFDVPVGEGAVGGYAAEGASAVPDVDVLAAVTELVERGAGSCVATVLGGRLVHRQR
ncbi:amidohydrolase family protein [Streptomyces sp. bgisy100]|uniref:amidohydrolase family protein n=1 Tax=Streptomyces sp. bgisy100 TaxID=3413783 RepID=UPI003D758348